MEKRSTESLPDWKSEMNIKATILSLTAAAALIGGVVLAAAPAEAATPSANVTICYVYQSTGTPYTQTTTAQKWVGNTWVTTSTQAGTNNGCRTWSVAVGTIVRFGAVFSVGNTHFSSYGWVGPYRIAGTGNYSVGTYRVYQY